MVWMFYWLSRCSLCLCDIVRCMVYCMVGLVVVLWNVVMKIWFFSFGFVLGLSRMMGMLFACRYLWFMLLSRIFIVLMCLWVLSISRLVLCDVLYRMIGVGLNLIIGCMVSCGLLFEWVSLMVLFVVDCV